MTDAEIMKTLNCCQSGCCGYCPMKARLDCNGYLPQLAFDLIERQQKQIEKYQAKFASLQALVDVYEKVVKK